tara:strand:- start:137 stop:397 length:261 start_codon:yes stop_codon:yes gene_type:complete
MSKNKTKETTIANPEGKTVEELKEIAQTLQTQLQEHQKQANRYQTMSMKAQGALEVILQMIPRQEVEEMIKEESKNNVENGEAVES